MKLVVLGSPGVGKGTYAQELVKELKIPHVSSGVIFRENIEKKTRLGKKAEQYISAGRLVPDELTISLIERRLKEKECQEGFILDGFPRTIAQAEALGQMAKIDLVINFKADRAVIIDRLSGRRTCRSCNWIYHIKNIPSKVEGKCDHCGGELFQRPDDIPEAIETRLDTYEKETAPLVDYYRKKGILKEVIINEEFGKYREVIMERIKKVINSIK